MKKLINDNKPNHFLLFKPKKLHRKPFIISSPHSGEYLNKYLYNKVNIEKEAYLSMNDMYINDISIFMKDIGATILQSNVSRIMIDLNRAVNEIDPSYINNPPRELEFNLSDKVKAGIGLIPTRNSRGKEIYKSKLSWEDIEYKIKNYYLPWHEMLREEIDSLYKKFGTVFILDLHSMPSEFGYNNVTDFIIGNDFDNSSTKLSRKILSGIIKSYGYEVSSNNPYSGGYITKNYCSKYKNIQCIQLEVKRDLYMNERNFKKKGNFKTFSLDLKNIINKFSNEINCDKKTALAAE